MSFDPKNPHYDPYTAPPVFDNQPVTGGGYPDSPQGGYPDSAPPQQAGYPDPYANYTTPSGPQPGMPAGYNPAGFAPTPAYMQPMENGTGTAALVLGIIGLVGCTLCAIPAVICGHIGVKKADRGEANNRGQAQAGLVMGYIGIGLMGVVLLIWIIAGVLALGASSTTP